MIDLRIGISRSFWYSGDFAQTLESYEKELTVLQTKLKEIAWEAEHYLFGSKDLADKWQDLISTELSYCRFYKEYAQRKTSEQDFNKWVFTKKDDIKPLHDWDHPTGGRWTKTNGKTKATIQYDRSGIMCKLTLKIENDSPAIQFLSPYSEPKFPAVHASKEATIIMRVEEMKQAAEHFMQEHQYGDKNLQRELAEIKQLLWIEE